MVLDPDGCSTIDQPTGRIRYQRRCGEFQTNGRLSMPGSDLQAELASAIPSDLISIGRTPGDQEIFHSSGPAIVGAAIRAQNAEQICAAISVAANSDRKVSVLTTGHGLIDGLAADIALNLAAFDDVSIDADQRIATIGGGASWARAIAQCEALGLAPLSGSSPLVGAVGYLTGGGIGLLSREYGFCADHVVDIELVTGSGQVLNASAAEHSDLFWAVRGGQSSAGVVTKVRVPLFPIARFYGGNLVWDAAQATEVIAKFTHWMPAIPESMSFSLALIDFPPAEGVPELMRGKKMLVARLCTTDESGADESIMAALVAQTMPIANTLRSMPLGETATIHADPPVRGDYRSWSSGMNQIGDSTLQAIEDWCQGHFPGVSVLEFRAMGGAMARRPSVENCVDSRDFPINCFASGAGHAGQLHELDAVLTTFAAQVSADRAESLLINFVGGVQLDEACRAYLPGTLERLDDVIGAHDPHRVMRTVIDSSTGN